MEQEENHNSHNHNEKEEELVSTELLEDSLDFDEDNLDKLPV